MLAATGTMPSGGMSQPNDGRKSIMPSEPTPKAAQKAAARSRCELSSEVRSSRAKRPKTESSTPR